MLTNSSHLLGKKSWNVYNADNIARVRQDEAAAKAAEEAEEQRMQEFDAQRRLAILRGETPPPLPETEVDSAAHRDKATGSTTSHPPGTKRKRKRHGEDDTDFELRLAKERNEVPQNSLEVSRQPTSSAPIVDHAGHIDLFGDERARAHAEKNEEAEREKHKKKREYEDQYTMRFSNAAGRGGLNKPWYSHADLAVIEQPSKDAWGNEDPRRKERDSQRIVANDPLAMMKKGASKIRELKQERKRFQEEREAELKQLQREDRHREKRRRRDREKDAADGESRERRRPKDSSRDSRHDRRAESHQHCDDGSRSRRRSRDRYERDVRLPNDRQERRRYDD
ncbi:hypothetical protein S40288_00629 [Stachybotrys chartarum IBT 40288]|nr:hypothetical protein S40288_00629 [Stachybotrys chartarum IBT 40288]